MPVTHECKGRLLRMEFVGTYEPEDVTREFLAALADPACPENLALLVDTTRSESLGGRNPGQIRLVAEFLKPYAQRIGGRCAIVATEDLHFGLSRMGSVYSEAAGVETQVFRDAEAALMWLGVR